MKYSFDNVSLTSYGAVGYAKFVKRLMLCPNSGKLSVALCFLSLNCALCSSIWFGGENRSFKAVISSPYFFGTPPA